MFYVDDIDFDIVLTRYFLFTCALIKTNIRIFLVSLTQFINYYGSMIKRKPVVRRQPLINKIKSFPFDLFLWLNEIRLSIEWDNYCDSIAIPLSCSLTLIYLILIRITVYYELSYNKRENPLFQADYYNYEKIRSRAISGDPIELSINTEDSWWYTILNFTIAFLGIISLSNFVYVLFSFKYYTLLYSSMAEKPKSSSARRLVLKNDINDSIFDKIYKFFYSHTNQALELCSDDESFYDEDTINEINLIEKDIWELKVWNPSKFSLFILTNFSPILLFIIRLISKELPVWKILFITIIFNGNFYFIVTQRFLVLLQDKQILYQEMFQEYNNKFVKPKTSVLKKDVVIDATFGPLAPSNMLVQSEVKPHLQNTRLKVFITHNINGEPFNNITIEKNKSISPEKDQFPRSFKYQQVKNSYRDSPSMSLGRNDLYRHLRQPNTDLTYDESRYENEKIDRERELSRRSTIRQTPMSLALFENIEDYSDNENKLWYSISTPYSRKNPNMDNSFHRSTPMHESTFNRGLQSPIGKLKNNMSLNRTTLSPSRSLYERSLSPQRRTPGTATWDSRSPSPKRLSRPPSPSKPKPRWH